MRLLPARSSVRTTMALVAIWAVAVGGVIALHRESRAQRRRAMAEYESNYSRACLHRIPQDI